MKKNYFLLALLTLSVASFAQKTILVNGGQFGNSSENANVLIYDTQTQTSVVIDTIQTQSVQDILIDGNTAFVAAQDSIVKYDLALEQRIAANAFNGVSTKTFALSGNELLVGNWYAKSSDNLYIYDKNTLTLLDSVSAVEKGAISILTHNGYAYISQNASSSNYTDTLGFIIKVDIVNRAVVDTIKIPAYTQDIGQLVLNPNGNGFFAINSGSNTIATVDFASLAVTNNTFMNDLRVGGKSHYSIHADTMFARMDNGIGAINLTTLNVLSTNIIDTVITAFTYDSLNANFYVTQTDFFSYNLGKIYNRSGNKINTLMVGYSPEVICMFYDQTVGLDKDLTATELAVQIYPNPATNMVNISSEKGNYSQIRLFDTKGRILFEDRMLKDKTTLSVNHLPKGLYFVELSNEGMRTSKPLILK